MNGYVVGALLVVTALMVWFYGAPLLAWAKAWLKTWGPR